MAAFDPTKTSSNLTLSNGDKTIVANASPSGWLSNQCAISDFTLSSLAGGLWYWEMSLSGSDSELGILRVGICDQGATSTFNKDTRIGYGESWAAIRDYTDGFIFQHDSSSAGDDYSFGCGNGSVIMFAVDMDNGKFWLGVDGAWLNSGNPASGTNPVFNDSSIAATDISACAATVVVGSGSITTKFEATEFTYSIPSGFSAPPASNEIGISEGIGIADEIHAENVPWGQAGLIEGIGFADVTGRNIIISRGISDGIGLSDAFQSDRIWTAGISESIGLADAIGGISSTAWFAANYNRAIFKFFASIGDYALPGMKTLQYRMRNDEASYLEVTFPYNSDALNAISARTDDEIIIEMAAYIDGSESLREELLRADFYSIRYDRGATNQSITLVGYKTRAYSSNRITLRDVSGETMLADGRMQYRCAWPDFYLRPGDVAVSGSDGITVGSIFCVITPVMQYMDVQEVSS